MNDTTNETALLSSDEEEEQERVKEFMQPGVEQARAAGIPEVFSDNTAVFLYRTLIGGGYVLAAFDPAVLVQWANNKSGFRLTEGVVNFLPMGMPVLGLGLEDLDATKEREEQGDNQQ